MSLLAKFLDKITGKENARMQERLDYIEHQVDFRYDIRGTIKRANPDVYPERIDAIFHDALRRAAKRYSCTALCAHGSADVYWAAGRQYSPNLDLFAQAYFNQTNFAIKQVNLVLEDFSKVSKEADRRHELRENIKKEFSEYPPKEIDEMFNKHLLIAKQGPAGSCIDAAIVFDNMIGATPLEFSVTYGWQTNYAVTATCDELDKVKQC